ncbi:uncharacterized protein LOC143893899 [Temnothorax americanus]|uniref:uncharacterized protein LOC143893899 n=1 Tax=Temnothorax americanus TaxID=1964332 RepID=UPI004068E1D7
MCNLQKKVCQDEPRIEWNFMNRSMLRNVGSEAMRKHLVKYIHIHWNLSNIRVKYQNYVRRYKYWPFQFMVHAEESSVKQQEGESAKCLLYQCYIDLSELVFPGIKSTRVVAQLYTHDALSMAEKTGLEKDIFSMEPWSEDLKGRESEKSIQSDIETTQSTPLTSDTGEPVFVIVEIELFRPLVPCRLETDLSDIIEETMKPKAVKPHYVYSDKVAEQQYATCIQKLVETITESYRVSRSFIYPLSYLKII